MISTVPRPPLRVPGVADLYLVGETVAAGAVQMDNAARSALDVAALIRPSTGEPVGETPPLASTRSA
jgi:hypothetical protein